VRKVRTPSGPEVPGKEPRLPKVQRYVGRKREPENANSTARQAGHEPCSRYARHHTMRRLLVHGRSRRPQDIVRFGGGPGNGPNCHHL